MFTWQYRNADAYLRSGEFQAIAGVGDKSMRSSVYLTAFVVMAIGLAAFSTVFARL